MAKKKEEAKKAVLEREYNVPLRKEWLKVPKYKRAKKAVTALRQFIQKHMKSDDVKILREANLKVWERGIKNPPHHIKVKAVKDSAGVVTVQLFGVEEPKKEEKTAEKKPAEKKALKKEDKKGAEPAKAEKSAEKKEETKPEEAGKQASSSLSKAQEKPAGK